VNARTAADRRAQALDRLGRETFDLVVVGAGIIGSRVAYEAARVGLRVALLDRGDFGGATSSASSKLIHGGFRYLAQYDFGLVREAHGERRILLSRVAPHLVHHRTFVLPLYRGAPLHPVVIAAALVLYSSLAGLRESKARLYGPARARAMVPGLRQDGLRAAAVFEDAQTNDSRLCLATVGAAARAGAVVLNQAAVVGFDHAGGAIGSASVAAGGQAITVRCRAVVNAAGSWVDAVRRLDDRASQPIVRLSKGVHLTLPLDADWRAALIVPVDGTRVTFAIPWEGLLLLGTTDTAYEGDPAEVAPGPADVAQILSEAGLALPVSMLDPKRVCFSFAGLRALPLGAADTARAPREHLVAVSPSGMISVAGGKLTTHRLIAIDVLRRLPGSVLPQAGSLVPDDAPLPGSGTPALPVRAAPIDPALWVHLQRTYGSEAPRVLEYGERDPTALQRIHPDGPDIWAQAHYAIDGEWALTVEDIVRRRLTLSVRGLADDAVRARLADLLRRYDLDAS
jgi:glycerol-3-phosphate dehydrogenase